MVLGSSAVILEGKVISNPVLIGSNRVKPLYECLIETPRQSNKVDNFIIHYTDSSLKVGDYISIVGELRTLNISGDRPVKCFISVYKIEQVGSQPEEFGNSISITNALVINKRDIIVCEGGTVQSFDMSIMRSHGRKSVVQGSVWHGVVNAFNSRVEVGSRLNLWGRVNSSVSSSGNRYISVLVNKFEILI